MQNSPQIASAPTCLSQNLFIAPLFLVSVSVASLFSGEQAAEAMVASARDTGEGKLAAAFGLCLLVFSATGIFAHLKKAMNMVWEIRKRPGQGLKSFLKSRFRSLSLVIAIGFLLMVSLVISKVISTAGAQILILSWVFYTSNIVLFGAEFTQVWARHRGREIRPTEKADGIESLR